MSEAERTGASRQDQSARLLAGRYRLGGVLGRGGMGTVWRAEDETLGRTVAVKELRFPTSIDEEEKRRLITRTLREAKAIARIRNTSAVTVFDVVQEDDRPWIVMELVEGKSLAEAIREDGLLEPRRAAEVGLAILDVLRSAHREGILHRDVKPSNVLIAEDGRVVLTDFGIAQVEGDPSITSTGMLVGAPSYISPERARGHKPGPAADLWSLGGLLYAAVEGGPPYDKGSAIATLTAVMTEPLEEPKNAGPLADVIRGLLTKDPLKRLDDAGARAKLHAVIHAPESGGAEPADATRAIELPPQPDRRSEKASPGTGRGAGQGSGPGGESGGRLRGALRSGRKGTVAATGAAAAGVAGAAGAAAVTRTPGGGTDAGAAGGVGGSSGGASGASGGASGGSGGSSGSSASSPVSSGGSGASGKGAASVAAGMPAEAGASRGTGGSGGSAGKAGAAGAGSVAGSASGGGSAAGGGSSSAGGAGANGTAPGRSASGWPVVPPPDLPARTAPRASLTDVVPRRTLLIIAVVVLLAALGVVLSIMFSGDDASDAQSDGGTPATPSATASADTRSEEGGGTGTDGAATDPAAQGGTPDTGAAQPDDEEQSDDASDDAGEDGGDSSAVSGVASTYEGQQGYSVGLPEGWKYESSDSAGDRFTGPDGQKLLVGWTTTPKDDPVADWENQERSMSRAQYERIRIAAVDYRGWNTADWEFTYVESGTQYRSVDRGFVVDDDQGYALMYTAKAANWGDPERADTWSTLTESFEPKP
ncbi:serine/threonine-protein kinase [Streptomyces sp. NPDC056716]|uniref:serine/threonine-protein kinase n=1 Tax=unclassified Streptomyces TaxID=2593676 RepID=UPI00367824DF